MAEVPLLRANPTLEEDLGRKLRDFLNRANLLVRSQSKVGSYAGRVVLRSWGSNNPTMVAEGYGLAALACAADGSTVTQETHIVTDRNALGCGQLCSRYQFRLNRDGTACLVDDGGYDTDRTDSEGSYNSALERLDEMSGKFPVDKFTRYDHGDPASDTIALNYVQTIDMTRHDLRDPAIRAAVDHVFVNGVKYQDIELK